MRIVSRCVVFYPLWTILQGDGMVLGGGGWHSIGERERERAITICPIFAGGEEDILLN